MKSNCNLELRLGTPSVSDHSSHEYEYDHDYNAAPEKKQLSIFYNGRIATCDVTEIQARAIIALARRELDQEITTTGPTATSTGLSMKRSLQRFLQKRKTRAQSTSPYTTTVRYQYCKQ